MSEPAWPGRRRGVGGTDGRGDGSDDGTGVGGCEMVGEGVGASEGTAVGTDVGTPVGTASARPSGTAAGSDVGAKVMQSSSYHWIVFPDMVGGGVDVTVTVDVDREDRACTAGGLVDFIFGKLRDVPSFWYSNCVVVRGGRESVDGIIAVQVDGPYRLDLVGAAHPGRLGPNRIVASVNVAPAIYVAGALTGSDDRAGDRDSAGAVRHPGVPGDRVCARLRREHVHDIVVI